MGRLAYSQIKPAWHLDRIEDLRKGIRPKPVHVQLVLSDLCNQDCAFCAYRMSSGLSSDLFVTEKTHNPNRKIATEKALEIVDDCATLGVKAIQFTGGGEPTVHKDHLEIFSRAQQHGIETSLVTNAVKLTPDHPAILNMTWIRVSIDAGTRETYSKIRRVAPSHWDRVWRNLAALRQNYNGTLGVGFVVTTENYTEINNLAAMASALGIDNMRIGAVFSEEGIGFYGDHIESISSHIEEAKANHDGDGFEVIDMFGRRLGDLEHGRPDSPVCNYQYFTMYIGADLNVYRCCNTAYTTPGTVGNLKDKSLVECFDSLAYDPFDARRCRFCQFLGQNEAIEALVKEPIHSAFV